MLLTLQGLLLETFVPFYGLLNWPLTLSQVARLVLYLVKSMLHTTFTADPLGFGPGALYRRGPSKKRLC